MYKVSDYLTDDGHDPYKEWLGNLADRQARARVVVRVQRDGSWKLWGLQADCRGGVGIAH
ncbi:MAG: hypothetical protein WC091_24310 [Sulfuricellaceae bacterium]